MNEINWSEKLPHVVKDKSGKAIGTRDDARSYLLRLPMARQDRQSWKALAKLLLDGAPVEDVARQLQYALFLDGALDLKTANIGAGTDRLAADIGQRPKPPR